MLSPNNVLLLTVFRGINRSSATLVLQVRRWWVLSCFASEIMRCSPDPGSRFQSEIDRWEPPPLNLIWCWALHYGSTSGREIRAFAWSFGWGRDQTLLLGVLLPSHQSCSLPPQVSIRGKTASDVWHVMGWWYMSYETETLNRRMYYLCFSLYLIYVPKH